MLHIIYIPRILKSLQFCINTLALLSASRNDCLIHSINNNFRIKLPAIELNINKEMEMTSIEKPNLYLLDLDHIKLTEFIHKFGNDLSFNPRARYILAGMNLSTKSSNILASKHIWDVIFVNKVSRNIFTYFPFRNRILGSIDSKWVDIGNCESILTNHEVLFQDKIPKVWTNSSISIMHSIAPPIWICTECLKDGYDSELFHIIFSHMNLTEKVLSKQYFDEDWHEENLKSLYKKQSDIITGEPPYSEVEFTYPHFEYFYVLVVPTPDEMPRWKIILTLFSMQVWLVWAIACLSSYITGILFDVVTGKFNVNSFYDKASLIFNLSLGQSYKLIPKIMSEYFFFVSVIFFTTIMAFIYTGRFPFFLVGINFEESINSLEDIMSKKLKIGTPANEMTREYFGKSEKMKIYYDQNRVYCDFTEECLDQLIAGKNMTFEMFSSTTPEYQEYDDSYTPYEQRPETYIVPVLFFVIFVLGTMGNGTLVVIFLRHRAMRNVPNTYIFSLALADLLVILTCVPFTSTLYTVESWPWGDLLCRVSEISKNISIGVSVFTLTALSVERYCAVVNPLRRLQTKPLTVSSAVIIWILAAALTIPDGIKSTLDDIDIGSNRTITICTPFPNATTSKTYIKYNVIMKSLIFYIIPLMVIASFYILMAIKLQASAKEMPGENKGAQGAVQARARRNVARMVLIFIFLFFICFLPNHVFMLWFHLYPKAEQEYNDWWHVIRITGFCLSFLNSCVNPIALYCVSGVFRSHFNRYLFCSKNKLMRSSKAAANNDSSLSSTFRRQTQASMLDNCNSVVRRNPFIKRESTDCTSIMTVNQSQKDKMTNEELEELQILHNEMAHKKNVYIS